MRDGTRLRGESARVSARVRALLDDAARDHGAGDEPDDELPSGGGLLDRLGARFPVRADPGRRPVLALAAVAVVVAIGAAVWLLGHRPDAVPVSASVPSVAGSELAVSGSASIPSLSRSSSPQSAPSSSAAGMVVVDVAGKVRHPGVYRLPTGSRVDDAIKAAGGALRGVDLGGLNLAAVLADGQQVAVGRPAAAGGEPSATGGAPAVPGGSGAGAPVNLNTATLEQLETLPGIGPALGQRILDYRTEHGSFASVDQLDDVSGIGDVTFQRLKPLVSV